MRMSVRLRSLVVIAGTVAACGPSSGERTDSASGGRGELAEATSEGRALVAAVLGDEAREGAGFRAVAGGWRAERAAEHGRKRVEVTVPEREEGAVRVRVGGVSVGVRRLGGGATAARAVGDAAVYAHGDGEGTVVRVLDDGVEDHVRREAPRGRAEAIEYAIELGEGAHALRQLGAHLEVLGADGVPRVRMDAPYVKDADGRRIEAAVEVSGCPVDRSPASPVGRPVGRSEGECRLRVSWSGGRYPLVVDPAWRSTSSMMESRRQHAATRLVNGQVLIAGGTNKKTTELYKPPSDGDPDGVGAFMKTGDLPVENVYQAAMGPLPDFGKSVPAGVAQPAGGAILHGGRVGAGKDDALTQSYWLYDIDQGKWRTGTGSGPALARHTLLVLADQRLLVAGGSGPLGPSDETAIFDPKTLPSGAWLGRHVMPAGRELHAVALTTVAGKELVLVAGGTVGAAPVKTTGVYDVATDAWTGGPALWEARRELTATDLGDGKILVAGGRLETNYSSEQVDLVDLVSSKATVLKSLGATRGGHGAVRLGGRVLLTGGLGTLDVPSAELYDPVTPGPSRQTVMTPRVEHTTTWLGGSRVLVTGGRVASLTSSSAQFFRLLDQGAGCADSEECASGFCTDNVCCATSCGEECETCLQKYRVTGEPDGTCGMSKEGAPRRDVPGGSCAPSANVCGPDGTCSGKAIKQSEACHLPSSTTRCGADKCAPPPKPFLVCNGAGGCVAKTCAPYMNCLSADECASSCDPKKTDQCVDQTFCQAGKCVPLLAPGEACGGAGECQSGFCVDGVCCQEPCDKTCHGCSASGDGTCQPLAVGTKSDDCTETVAETCGTTGACDGKGECAQHEKNKCGETTCNTRPDGTAAEYSYQCQQGSCVPVATTSCVDYACAGDASCATTCTDDSGCVGGALCVGGECKAPRADGEECNDGPQCQSGVCAKVDGARHVCCNTTCEGTCEDCATGTCQATVGPPKRGEPCEVSTSGDACGARSCDGSTRDRCAGFVGQEVACDSCTTDGPRVAVQERRCGGNGQCLPPEKTISCGPYGCTKGQCRPGCEGDNDCAPRAHCEAGGCGFEASCDSETLLFQVDGTSKSCAPFRCDVAARACFARCTSSADCASGSTCESDGSCQEPPSPTTGAGDGCAVTAGGVGGRAPAGLLATIVLGMMAWRRRARRAAGALAVAALGGCAGPGPEGSTGPGGAGPVGGAEATPATLARADAMRRAAGGEGLGADEVTGYRAAGSGWRPELRTRRGAGVRLPAQADGVTEVGAEAGGVSVGVRLAGATSAGAVRARGGTLVYDGALGPGTSLIHRPSSVGTEDYALFDEATGHRELLYIVELGSEVAGVRFVSDTLEFLDAGGAPRLRMASPEAWGERGERVAVRTEVSGCEVDRDARAPWGRPVRAPGSRRCEVRLTWAPVAGPLLVDPAWQATGSLKKARFLHTVTLLPSGLVLAAGGADAYANYTVSGMTRKAELYDQVSKSWATTGDLDTERAWHGAWLLPSGKVLVAAGFSVDGALASSEVYDPVQGTWTGTGDLSGPRYTQANGALADGTPFVCGGYRFDKGDKYYLDAQVYRELSGSWQSVPGLMSHSHRYSAVFAIPNNRMLVAGGTTYDKGVGEEEQTTVTEIYDVANKTWSEGPPMKSARFLFGATATPKGVVYAGGASLLGKKATFEQYSTVEFFRFSDETFVSLATMKYARVGATVAWLDPLDRVMVAGGANLFSGALGSAELVSLDPALPTTDAGTMTVPRAFASATLLPSGALLVAGGGTGSPLVTITAVDAAEQFATTGLGAACTQDGECPRTDPKDPASQHCVDGFCCATACDGICQACSAARKGGGADGVCGNVAAKSDPHGDCTKSDNGCGLTGVCDGAGSCERYNLGKECARSCSGNPGNPGSSLTIGQCEQVEQVEQGKKIKKDVCALSTVACEPSLCDPVALACRATCATSFDCIDAAYCEPATHTCTPRRPDGTACDSGDACASRFCADGVCCNENCEDQPCHACKASLQSTPSPADGTCLPSKDNNPHNPCLDLPCVHHEYCDGQGQCAPYGLHQPCGKTACVGTREIGFGLTEFTCQADETNPSVKRCAPSTDTPTACESPLYGCVNEKCLTACQDDSQCTDKAYCADEKCVARLDNGGACDDKRECVSGFCVDGVCCNEACEGTCSRCNNKDQQGLCVPTTDYQAAPGRSPCPAAPPDARCEKRQCDGIHLDCVGYVGASETCIEPRCEGDAAVQKSICLGNGTCGEEVKVNCFPFRCVAGGCLTACQGDVDCAGTNRCLDGKCFGQLTCDFANALLRDALGNMAKSCGTYRCDREQGSCLSRCASSADCATGAQCSSQGACEYPSLPTEVGDDGCGCRLLSGPTSPNATPLALLALGALARRRSPAPRRARSGDSR